ncbi:MAG TPA: DUF3822 family protein [Flavobacterium sp.]|nr:DUF3822 family protein [Flavobacterium sp.]
MQSITEKNYRKLVLNVSLSGFSFAVMSLLSDEVLMLKEVCFSKFENPNNTLECYKSAFSEYAELSQKFDQVIVLHNNNLSSFVPTALFDAENLGAYLHYNIKTFSTDFFAFDALEHYQINNVYVPYVNINNFLIDIYQSFDYKHHSTILVEKLLDASKNDDDKQMFVHFHQKSFEIIVIRNQKLLFYNSFDFTTKEDFAYYLLFTIEQLEINPEFVTLKLLGHIAEGGELFDVAYTYIRHVSLMDITSFQEHNSLDNYDNLTHFVLLQS